MASTTSLFRVVSEAELADLRTRKAFRPAPGGIEVKLFWTTLADAERYASTLLPRVDREPSFVVSVVVPNDVLTQLVAFRADSRPALSVDWDQLAWFNDSILGWTLP
jgi:hypothetical protein